MRHDVIAVKYWERDGLFYVSTMRGTGWTRTRTLDFVSYHLILWIHGERRLRDMAMEYRE